MRTFPRFAAAVLLAAGAAGPAQAAPEFQATKEELSMLPPYCTALYGYLHGEPHFSAHPLRHTKPACTSVHHYCDALKSMLRADRDQRDKYLVTYALQQADQSLRGVIEEWKQTSPSCSLYPEAYTNLGKTILRRSRYGMSNAADAVSSFESAIQKNPRYEAAYLGMADLFIHFNNRNDALAALERGLQQVPNSKMLAKRYQKLGGKLDALQLPPPPAPEAARPPETARPSVSQEPVAQEPAARQEAKPAPPGSAAEPIVRQAGEERKIGSPTNPWCRFCTDDIDQPEGNR